MMVRRLPLAVLTFAASAALLVSACGGSGSTEATPATTATTPTPTVADPATPGTVAQTDTTSSIPAFGLPADYVAPPGWIESTSRFDNGAGIEVYSVDEPRLVGFLYTSEGCCDAGLDASFGSPDFPRSDDARDLGDGLYLASITDWNPAIPDEITLSVRRVVDCAGPEAASTYYCPIHDFEPGRFEALDESREFRFDLDDDFIVRLFAALEPTDADEFYTTYTWVGNGPALADFLAQLHATYSALVTEPFRSGATYADIATGLDDEPTFREVSLSGWLPFGAWQPVGGPALTYDKPDSLVPSCSDARHCIDGGDPQSTPRSFESLIGQTAGLHVAAGRFAFTLMGATLGG